eukprot:scaffold14553_cov120-Isochrysis_galbana.AAC.3
MGKRRIEIYKKHFAQNRAGSGFLSLEQGAVVSPGRKRKQPHLFIIGLRRVQELVRGPVQGIVRGRARARPRRVAGAAAAGCEWQLDGPAVEEDGRDDEDDTEHEGGGEDQSEEEV